MQPQEKHNYQGEKGFKIPLATSFPNTSRKGRFSKNGKGKKKKDKGDQAGGSNRHSRRSVFQKKILRKVTDPIHKLNERYEMGGKKKKKRRGGKRRGSSRLSTHRRN